MFKIKLANSKTCWWSNSKGRYRHDTLIGITRSYNRIYKLYIYRFTIGYIKNGS